MSYAPSAPTIRERILQNLEATLRAINGAPTYRHHVRKVYRFFGNAFQIGGGLPAIVIVPDVQRNTDQRSFLIEHTLPIRLLLVVESQSWRTELEALLADCRVSLLADWTRGGIALTTRILGEEVFDSEPSAPAGGAQMDLEVLFRTLYQDPGAAF